MCSYCKAPALIQCPRCIDRGLAESPFSIFCTQQCLESAWKEHKVCHRLMKKPVADHPLIKKAKGAMQKQGILPRIYHEAPDDIFELIMKKFMTRWGTRSLNVWRLVDKRFKILAESYTTRHYCTDIHHPEVLPFAVFQRCRKIDYLECMSQNLRTLEGINLLPRLRSVVIEGNSVSSLEPLRNCSALDTLSILKGRMVTDLSPLASCSMMEELKIGGSSITDISAVASMPLLKCFYCQKGPGRPSIKDLSPLSSCPRLKTLFLAGNLELKDLSPLSACTALEVLQITVCPLITSLVPLSNLKSLKKLYCEGGLHTSLLPLASCTGLKELWCDVHAVDVRELQRRRPDIKMFTC